MKFVYNQDMALSIKHPEADGSLVRAGLNYGDCFSYALAKVSGQPLLFKGEAFRLTDVAAVH